MDRIRKELRAQWLGAVLGTLAIFIALGGPADAVTAARSLDKSVRSALKIAKRADKRSKKALSAAQKESTKTGQQGPAGAQGASGPAGQDGAPGTVGQPEAWRAVGALGEPAFQNSWINTDAVNFNSASFYKDPGGIVYLKGLVSGGTSTTIFQLPVGYRPTKNMYLAATDTLASHAEVSINFQGLVGRNGFASPSGPLSLEGISFRAEG